jgi:neutral ceramidase
MKRLDRRGFMKQAVLASGLAATPGRYSMAAAQTLNTVQTAGDTLMAGVAAREIAPPPGVPMWGYRDGIRLAEGTRDPLHARALALRAGGSTVALAVLELGRVPVKESCARIREKAQAAGIDAVIITATHTHSGPVMEMPGMIWLQPIEDAITEAVIAASEQLEPARIGAGSAAIDIGHNRRVIKDGKCYMLWRNAERKPTAPVDKEAGVIRIDRANGEPMAALVQYACHPVIFGPDNKQYSADWPGEMCRLVKEESGAECFFLQGACGDINPYMDKTPLEEGAVDIMREEGAKAGHAVLDTLSRMAAPEKEPPALACRIEAFQPGLRWNLDDEAQTAILKEAYGPMYDLYIKGLAPGFTIPLAAIVINNRIALSFWPGEIFVRFQLDLKAHSPLPDTFLCGYANEYHAYFPTVRDAALGGYGGITPTYAAVGAGERMLARSAAMIGEMTGMLRPQLTMEDLQLLDL